MPAFSSVREAANPREEAAMDNLKRLKQQILEKSAESNEERKIALFPPLSTASPERDKRRITLKQLINKLNHINFIDGTISVEFKHIRFHHTVSVAARPLPCIGEELECRWSDPEGLVFKLKSYRLEKISFCDSSNLIQFEPQGVHIRPEGIILVLPETGCRITPNAKRHVCKGIGAQLYQNGVLFNGSLIDFHSRSFRVALNAAPPQTFNWINPEFPANLILSDGRHTIYSGECGIIEQTGDQKNRIFLLERHENQIRRYHPKEFRSTRQTVDPSPDVIFRHPLTGCVVNLKVINLSGRGFSVEDENENSVLFPGMIIPEAELNFANNFSFRCMVQVMYRKLFQDRGNEYFKCGMTILDMNIEDHVKLLALIHQAKDRHSYVCSKVDLDALWRFFFESGLIYPEKYAFLQAKKDKIKQNYEKLYSRTPNIARHFIYQDKGRILAHMAALRLYENTWMIHHHASNNSMSNLAGFSVLNQLSLFINDSHSLNSIHMNYIMCYFRPENRFPNRIFGGACSSINNPKECSIDPFAYFHFSENSAHSHLPEGYSLSPSDSDDLNELGRFYSAVSGGLMLKGLDLEPDFIPSGELIEQYRKIGLKKENYRFSLKRFDELKAIFVLNISDIGLNMSHLTNCVKIVVTDSEGMTKDLIFQALSDVSRYFEQNEMPVLLYPVGVANSLNIPFEKIYNLWIVSVECTDAYFRFLKRIFKFVKMGNRHILD
jgi:hypothetical protein